MTEKQNPLSSWGKFIDTMVNAASKIAWTLVALIIIAVFGRFLIGHKPTNGPEPRRTTGGIVQPAAWHEVDEAIVLALKTAEANAQALGQTRLSEWTKDLQSKIDDNFLDWYFGYWDQQWLSLKAIGYRIADTRFVERIIGEQPSMAERITEDIQDEFSRRVLRPRIAQLQIERIAEELVHAFIDTLQKEIAAIPDTYEIPRPVWERYLEDIALVTSDIDGDRQVPVSLKTLYAYGGANIAVVSLKATQAVRPVIERVGSKVSAAAASRGAAAKTTVAAKSGGKVAAKGGGKFLGPIVLLGIVAWDVWDHNRTESVQRPILRQNLADYLQEMEKSLLVDPETGLMSVVRGLQANVISSLRHSKPNQPSEGTR